MKISQPAPATRRDLRSRLGLDRRGAITDPVIPHQSYSSIFLRFLRFGFFAWGGPVAQIAMIKQELAEEEKWISVEKFNRALAVYQVLPGPEAHELCVYFGMLARGRVGGVLAGLGFMLPGFFLMFGLSWVYVTYGISSPLAASALAAIQAAVVALIVRAVHQIGTHSVVNRWLWIIAVLAAVAQFFGVHFGIILLFSGIGYALASGRQFVLASAWTLVAAAAGVWYVVLTSAAPMTETATPRNVGHPQLFLSGLKAGLLTFGGAYTVIPFLQRDAVVVGAWMNDRQFLDGLGLSGILPAPLIIFATFVGYLGGGPFGALLLTIGIFLPAFSFTLIGHDFLERITHQPRLHAFLKGVTAGVVGLIAATTIGLFRVGVTSLVELGIVIGALATLYLWTTKWAVPGVIAAAAGAGILLRFTSA